MTSQLATIRKNGEITLYAYRFKENKDIYNLREVSVSRTKSKKVAGRYAFVLAGEFTGNPRSEMIGYMAGTSSNDATLRLFWWNNKGEMSSSDIPHILNADDILAVCGDMVTVKNFEGQDDLLLMSPSSGEWQLLSFKKDGSTSIKYSGTGWTVKESTANSIEQSNYSKMESGYFKGTDYASILLYDSKNGIGTIKSFSWDSSTSKVVETSTDNKLAKDCTLIATGDFLNAHKSSVLLCNPKANVEPTDFYPSKVHFYSFKSDGTTDKVSERDVEFDQSVSAIVPGDFANQGYDSVFYYFEDGKTGYFQTFESGNFEMSNFDGITNSLFDMPFTQMACGDFGAEGYGFLTGYSQTAKKIVMGQYLEGARNFVLLEQEITDLKENADDDIEHVVTIDPIPVARRGRVKFSINKLEDAKWPPEKVTQHGVDHTLKSIYRNAGLFPIIYRGNGKIKDLYPKAGWTEADLLSLMKVNRKVDDQVWYIVVTKMKNSPATLGIMFDSPTRKGCADFGSQFVGKKLGDPRFFMRTTAHEMGHQLNLDHDVGDGSTTIMNQTWRIKSVDDVALRFTTHGKRHLAAHPENCVKPGGSRFYSCNQEHEDWNASFTISC